MECLNMGYMKQVTSLNGVSLTMAGRLYKKSLAFLSLVLSHMYGIGKKDDNKTNNDMSLLSVLLIRRHLNFPLFPQMIQYTHKD